MSLPVATVVDVALAILLIEALALGVWRRRRGPPIAPWIPHLLAGAFLLLALRLSLDDAAPVAILAALGLGGASHVWDVAMRVRAHRG